MIARLVQRNKARDRRLVVLLLVALVASWVLAGQLVLRIALSDDADRLTAVSGIVFVAISAAFLGVLAVRQVFDRRETDRFHQAIAMLTDPGLSRLAPVEMVDEFLVRTRDVLEADVVALMLVGDDGHLTATAVSGSDTPATPVPPGEGVYGQVASLGEPVLTSDLAASWSHHAFLGERANAFVGCPVLVDGEVRGVIGAESSAKHRFTLDDLQLLRRVAERLATAVERSEFDALERRAMDAVAEGEHRVRTLVEAAPVGIVETDLIGTALRWNRAAAAMLGWPRWLEGTAAPSPLPVEVHDGIELANEGRRTERLTARVERQGARSADLVVSVTPVTSREGTVDGVLVLFDDITERQQMEAHVRQAQRLEAMGRLAGGVAHGFNNLLTVILGYSEVLMRTLAEDDERREDLQAIRTAGQQATELTQQLLSIGRKPVVEPEICDLHDKVRYLEPVLRRLVGDDIELRVVTAMQIGRVRVDPTEFDQAVMNLVINARDATRAGGRIVVETRGLTLRGKAAISAGVRSGQYVMVTVADTGSGMPPDVLDHCFDPFFTTKGPGKGTGIGLAAVYGTVTGAGGHVTVESEVDRGTTFRLWFPVADADAKAGRKSALPAAPRKRKGPTGRVLIVDDEAPVRNLARAILEEAGHIVVEASSGLEAIVKADNNPPFDVVVSDMIMPRMRGDEMVARLQQKFPRQRVVLMSAYTDHASEVEPDVFLRKPFALDELVAVVGDLVAQRRRPRSAKASSSTKVARVAKAATGSKKKATAKEAKAQVKEKSKAKATKTTATRATAATKAKKAGRIAGRASATPRSGSQRREPSSPTSATSGRPRSGGAGGGRAR